MTEVGLIFPNQLYKNVPISKSTDNLILIEYSLFFGEKKYINNFHQNKLVLHRASMKSYFENELDKFNSKYIDYNHADLDKIFNNLKNAKKIFVYEPKDF